MSDRTDKTYGKKIFVNRNKEREMIVCIGEILADMTGTDRKSRYQFDCYAGGAPFNVSCGIARLGGDVTFAGCVGQDAIGAYLKRYADGVEGLRTRIATDRTRNTTLAFVTLSEAGERSFSFFRKNTADYALDMPMVEDLIRDAQIVHIGSLMLSEESGRAFAEEVFGYAKRCKKRVSFDVNYREDIYESAEEAKRIYSSWLTRADILKLSEDEAELFYGAHADEELRALSKDKMIFVTLGKAGAKLYVNGEATLRPTIDVKVVDTNGAGDAFYAGALFKILCGESDPVSILDFANVCGALATTRHGATEVLPSLKEIEGYLKRVNAE